MLEVMFEPKLEQTAVARVIPGRNRNSDSRIEGHLGFIHQQLHPAVFDGG